MGEAEHEAGGADGGFAVAALLLVVADAVVGIEDVRFVPVVLGDDAAHGIDAGGKMIHGDGADAAGAEGFDGVDAGERFGAGDPGVESLNGGVEALGDGVERFGRREEGFDDFDGGFFGWGEEVGSGSKGEGRGTFRALAFRERVGECWRVGIREGDFFGREEAGNVGGGMADVGWVGRGIAAGIADWRGRRGFGRWW